MPLRLAPIARPRLYWYAMTTAGLAFTAWLGQLAVTGTASGTITTTIFALSIIGIMLIAYRAPLINYAGLVLATTMLVGIATQLVSIAVVWCVGFAGLLISLNYGVQLFLDHEREARLIFLLKQARKRLANRQVFQMLVPPVLLLGIGLVAHQEIQNHLLNAAYADPEPGAGRLALVDKNCRVGPIDAQQLERDIECTINEREKVILAAADAYIQSASSELLAASKAGPEKLAAQLQALRPPTIDTYSACDGFQVDLKFDSLTFRSPCRTLINHINEALTRSHAKMTARINSTTATSAKQFAAEVKGGTDDFRKATEAEIRASMAQLRAANRHAFVAAQLLNVLSWVIMLVSLVAAYQMLLARVLFDVQMTDSERAQGLTFKLAGDRDAQALSYTHSHVLVLSHDITGPTRWFVSLRMARKGPGTAMNVHIPQPTTSVFQRILANNYILTAIDIPGVDPDGAQISVAGDHKLVRVKLKPGQRVCFRTQDLVAFTEQVRLSARYSTHAGGSLLGLGPFYTVAEGVANPADVSDGESHGGYVVFRSEGLQVSKSEVNGSTPVSNLLVWDEAQAFSLDQHLNPVGVWVNQPSLVTRSTAGSALLDEGQPGRWPILSRIGQLFRYVLLPV